MEKMFQTTNQINDCLIVWDDAPGKSEAQWGHHNTNMLYSSMFKSQIIQHLKRALPCTHVPQMSTDDAVVADHICTHTQFLHDADECRNPGGFGVLAASADGAWVHDLRFRTRT